MSTNTHTQDYAEVLEGQLEPVDSERDGGSGEDIMVLGRNFSSVELDLMSEQQLGQLMELKSETNKPKPNRRDDH